MEPRSTRAQPMPQSADEALSARYPQRRVRRRRARNEIRRLLDHRSVRAYLADALPDGARWSGSSRPRNPPRHPPTCRPGASSPSKIRSARRVSPGSRATSNTFSNVPVLLVWIADHARIRGLSAAAGAPVAGLDYFESFLVAAIDAALAARTRRSPP